MKPRLLLLTCKPRGAGGAAWAADAAGFLLGALSAAALISALRVLSCELSVGVGGGGRG